jgi:hypothetical protein
MHRIREIVALLAALFADTVIAQAFDKDILNWKGFLIAIVVFGIAWALCDWFLGVLARWREAKRNNITGFWGSLVRREGEDKISGISVVNIHSMDGKISVEGRTFELEYSANGSANRDSDGEVSLKVGGDWHSTQAAYSDDTLLYMYASQKEKVTGICGYKFTWANRYSAPRGYNGTFYDFGGRARTVQGARAGAAIDLSNVNEARKVAQSIYNFFHSA